MRSVFPFSRRFLVRVKLVAIAFCLGLICYTSYSAYSNEHISKEYKVKAAFIYNFLKFIEWPEEALEEEAALHICIVGTDPFGPALKPIQEKTINGHDIVLDIEQTNTELELSACHMLFISKKRDNVVSDIVNMVANKPIVTVSDIENFVQKEGIIGFIKEGSKIKFTINATAAEKSNLRISSKLLELATKVF